MGYIALRRWMLGIALTGLMLGGCSQLIVNSYWSNLSWAVTALLVSVPALVIMIDSMLHGKWGVDLLGVVAIISALLVGEYLAAAIVATMLSSGYALEGYAEGKAQAELSALIKRVPTIAHKKVGTTWQEVPVGDLAAHDQVLVRAGDTVPVDGILLGRASLDQSAMTGESTIVERAQGSEILSGVVNAGEAFEMMVLRSAADSADDALVELVRQASLERAPFVRLADRYARWFLPVSLCMAAVAWVWSEDPVRMVAVLVVATPCPLILAAPIALVAGLSCAAHEGIIVKNGSALERISRADKLMVDKTGTLTLGEPGVSRIVAMPGYKEESILSLAASLEQFSAHVVAEAMVARAEKHNLELLHPQDVVESPGQGISGYLPQTKLVVGSPTWIAKQDLPVPPGSPLEGETQIGVIVNGQAAGSIFLADQIRGDAKDTLLQLTQMGISETVMLTGDRTETAEKVASKLSLGRVYAELNPQDKMAIVAENSGGEHSLIMLGDGINDAPSLALADVGIAMGGRGSAASAQSADIVIAEDRLALVSRIFQIGKRTLHIARQSVWAGMIMSGIAMLIAFMGYLPPALGALGQEGIDVAVILNALRALQA